MTDVTASLPALWLASAHGPDEKEALENTLKSSRTALRVLREMVKGRLAALEMDETSIETYESPSWGFRQAHLNGKRDAYKELIGLVRWIDQP